MFTTNKKVTTVMFAAALAMQVAPAFADDAAANKVANEKQTVVSTKKQKNHKAKLAMVGADTSSTTKNDKVDGYIPDSSDSTLIIGE